MYLICVCVSTYIFGEKSLKKILWQVIRTCGIYRFDECVHVLKEQRTERTPLPLPRTPQSTPALLGQLITQSGLPVLVQSGLNWSKMRQIRDFL